MTHRDGPCTGVRRASRALADLTVTGLASLPVRGRASSLAMGSRGVECLAPFLALSLRQQHDGAMPRGHTQHPTPDLFSEASAPEAPPTPASQVSSPQAAAVDVAVSVRRYLLPKDLPNALKRLDDGELASLLVAALDEAKRRGKLPSGLAASALDDPTPRGSRKGNKSSTVRPAHVAILSLTRGQVNAVRAAFKAGIAPSRIAREFGISQSEVRKLLASDARQRGRES